ncbi:hypothetical protein GC169_02895 [bacterium]|nr:hypothetical protein [bacterium]
MLRVAAISAVATLALAPSLSAQRPGVVVTIDPQAGYEQALACYRYYDVAEQVANATLPTLEAGSEQRKALQVRNVVNQTLKMTWNKHIDATKGGKSGAEIDADLDRVGAPIIADANAGLGGDAEATARYDAVQVQCKTLERAAG